MRYFHSAVNPVLVVFLLINCSYSQDASPEVELNVSKIWESSQFTKPILALALSPVKDTILILDGSGKLSLVDWTKDARIFSKVFSNASLGFSNDGKKICVVEFNKRATLLDSSNGRKLALIDRSDLKGQVRIDVLGKDPSFFCRATNAKILKLNFFESGKKTEVVFDAGKQFDGIAQDELVREFDIKQDQCFGIFDRFAFSYDIKKQKLNWKTKSFAKLVSYVNDSGGLVTDTKNIRNPLSIVNTQNGTAAAQFTVLKPKTRLIRDNSSSMLFLLDDVYNAPSSNRSTLRILNSSGKELSSTAISTSRTQRLTDVITRGDFKIFARAGMNGEIQIWKIALEK